MFVARVVNQIITYSACCCCLIKCLQHFSRLLIRRRWQWRWCGVCNLYACPGCDQSRAVIGRSAVARGCVGPALCSTLTLTGLHTNKCHSSVSCLYQLTLALHPSIDHTSDRSAFSLVWHHDITVLQSGPVSDLFEDLCAVVTVVDTVLGTSPRSQHATRHQRKLSRN